MQLYCGSIYLKTAGDNFGNSAVENVYEYRKTW